MGCNVACRYNGDVCANTDALLFRMSQQHPPTLPGMCYCCLDLVHKIDDTLISITFLRKKGSQGRAETEPHLFLSMMATLQMPFRDAEELGFPESELGRR